MRRTRLRRGTPLRRTPGLRRRTVLRRSAPLARAPFSPASEAQRETVLGLRCVVCGATPVDPAHLIARAQGGCDHPDCVVALCRAHHRVYDRGELALLGYLEPRWRAQVAHAVAHVGLMAALWRLTALRPQPRATH
ncbi:MAG: HNH endonuclease [Actinomycetota bacterium]|nr:HNH endonuclease [Actinomycetota bacterium]